jgi:3'-phosphoadenosine 5'-phosphosulfate sulfotransferase (PAPS reductase)/FAD synthetase
MNIERIVIWFSSGVTSAVAAKITVNKYAGILPVHLVNCDTGSEDDDNWRFAHEVSTWVGLPLEIIRNEKYEDTIAVYRSSGFIKSVHGAKCTYELKKLPRRQYENLATDLQVFGYDADEKGRAQRFNENNPEVATWFPLIEEGITKTDARQILAQAGIQEPLTYSLGFKNANCLKAGCVKGGMGYWNHIRKVYPAVFWNMAKVEREIGHAICSSERQGENGERIKIPVYLDELPPDAGNYDSEPAFQCGLFCGQY